METSLIEGRLKKRQGPYRRPHDCRVFIAAHHAAYIDWATYEENQRMTHRNSVNWTPDESMAAIRAGQRLLVACCAVATAAASCMCATAAALQRTLVIDAKATTMTAGGTALVLVAQPWIGASVMSY